jgi:GWxTD domain-containing protein
MPRFAVQGDEDMKTSSYLLLTIVAVGGIALPGWSADKLSKDEKRWLESVDPLIQPEEEKIFKDIPKADRSEFQKIFWAIRNPKGPEAPSNDFQTSYEKAVVALQEKIKLPGANPATSDCGRMYLLVGAPESVKELPGSGGPEELTMIMRKPELWTLEGGKVQVAFDGACKVIAQGKEVDTFRDHMKERALGRIISPALRPVVGSDGRLVPLSELLVRAMSPAQLLLREPRQDFTFKAQPKLAMRTPDGAVFLAGLVRAPSAGMTVVEDGGVKKVTVGVAVQAVDQAGKKLPPLHIEKAAAVEADGSFVVSYGALVSPGRYTLSIAVADPVTKKGSLMSLPAEAADFGAPGMQVTDILVLSEIQENPTPVAKDPLRDFMMGSVRFVPRFDNAFKKSESVLFLTFAYNPTVNPDIGTPLVSSKYEVLKAGQAQPVTSSPMAMHKEPVFTPVVGPVPLAPYPPGDYTARLKVKDLVAKTEQNREIRFTVLP